MPKILILPGYDNSGPDHWQSWMERRFPDAVRVQQRNWLEAIRDEWVGRVEEEARRYADDVVLVGHSSGAITIPCWAAQFGRPIGGALIVGPTDMEKDNLPVGITGFAPIPRTRLPFRSIVVASTNDPWMDFEKARGLAQDWGSELVSAGDAGHINTASGHGQWPQGEELLRQLLVPVQKSHHD